MATRRIQILKPFLQVPMVALIASLPVGGTAVAAEFGHLRALQHGPVGDSPQYARFGEYEGEAIVNMGRTWGKYNINNDADAKISSANFKTRIAAGGAFSPSKNFSLSGYLDMTLASDYDEEQQRTAPKSHLDSGLYRHEFSLFGVYRGSPIVAGGGLGVLIVGSETREFEYDDDKYKQDITSAAMPLIRMFGGISTKDFDATLGLRLFAMGEAVVESQDAAGEKTEFDVVRRNPGEVHADGRLKLGMAQIAASLAWVMTAQSSEQIDEFSSRFVQDGNAKVRRTGGDRRNSDHVRIAAGTRFDPSKMFGILAGLTYTGASYGKEEYASLEHENLGGLRLDIGTEVHVTQFRGFFHAGYTMDQSASYSVEDSSRGPTNVDRTHRAPVNEGDKVKVTQGSWVVALGGGVVL